MENYEHISKGKTNTIMFLNIKICFFKLTPKPEQHCLNCISPTLGQNYQYE